MDTHVMVSRAVELSDPAFAATQALAHAPDLGVLCFDADLVIRSVQGSVFTPLGWTEGEMVERSLTDALGPAELAAFRSCCEAALRGEGNDIGVAAAGGGAQLQVSVAPVRIHDTTIVGGIAIARRTVMPGDALQATLRAAHVDRAVSVCA